jgi:hypothetical protein
MKHHSLLATFLLIAFLQILPIHAQRSSGSRGVDFANFCHGENIFWDFDDGVLRIWAKEGYENPEMEWQFADWSDCIFPYKDYLEDPTSWWENLKPEGDDWYGFDDISPAYPPFTETPWYALRELVRQIQIDGSIYYIGAFSLTYFTKCRSLILHEGVEKLSLGAITHLHNLEHTYFPSSLDYIHGLNFTKSPSYKELELVCDIPEPIDLVRVYWNRINLPWIYQYRKSRCFHETAADNSFLHVPSEEAVGLYTDWWEYEIILPPNIWYSWKDAFNNILHRTQPVVEGVDIEGGDIILAPTLNPQCQLSAHLIPSNAMRTTGRAGETGSGVTWNIGNYQKPVRKTMLQK